MHTFGWNLLQFARSVDHLNQEIVDGMKELTSDYFISKQGLDACYFCVHRTGAMFEGMTAFKTVWSNEQTSEAQVVRRFKDKDSSEAPNLRALAYNKDRCLWVTSNIDADGNEPPDGTTLDKSNAEHLVDQWRVNAAQDEQALPPYVALHDKPCLTLIALPLKHHGEKLGVLVVEFDRKIPITDGARQEAELVQEALGRILWLQDAAMSQQDGTRKAFEQLKNVVNISTSSVDPPTMFFAYPGNSDKAVTEAVKRIVKESYGNRLALRSWDEMADPGEITEQIISEISRCQYGICYLSELADGSGGQVGSQRYIDNKNVLIEAGMMTALKNNHLATTIAWISIREDQDRTDNMPFDFVTKRMIDVPRRDDGNLDVELFNKNLEVGIDAMLKVDTTVS